MLRQSVLKHLQTWTKTTPRSVYRVVPSLTFHRFNSTAQDEVLKKYTKQLDEKAKQLGLKDAEELKDKLKHEIEQRKNDLNFIDPLKELEKFDKEQAKTMEENRKAHQIKVRSPVDKDTPQVPYTTMSSYLDVEKIKDLNKTEIEFLWRARFQSKKDSLVAVLDNVQFANMYALAFKNRTFILPLPKEGAGYEMHFVQWAFVGPDTVHCMLTTVAEYKLHQEYAKPHTSLMFHQEIAQDKGVVLMNGQIEPESTITPDEAQLLVLNIQRFYGAMDTTSKSKLDLLTQFNSGDSEFNMDKLIDEAASIGN